MRSCPCPAEISEAMRAGTSAVLMWSTVALTPTCSPHSLTNASNQASCCGTKWLHIRIDRSPDRDVDGSEKTTSGTFPPPAPGEAPGDAAAPPCGSSGASGLVLGPQAVTAAARPAV